MSQKSSVMQLTHFVPKALTSDIQIRMYAVALRCRGTGSKGVLIMRTAVKTVVVTAMLLASASFVLSPALAGPIHDAAKADDAKQVEALIAAGADVDEKDAAYNTALHLAADKGLKDVVQVLVAHGANIDAKDVSDLTALQLAALGDHEAIVELLIAAGADVNATDSVGITVMDEATRRGNTRIIEMLNQAGAQCGTSNYSC